MPLGPDSLTEAQQRRLQNYVTVFGDGTDVFDLSQNPLHRPRHLLKCKALPTITKACRLYSTRDQRFLRGSEALTAQGWPLQRGTGMRDGIVLQHSQVCLMAY